MSQDERLTGGSTNDRLAQWLDEFLDLKTRVF
jgi:hypothetical protein